MGNEGLFERILALCKEKGTNVTAVCKAVTGSSGNLPTWKKGNVNSETLAALSDYFGTTSDFLLRGEPLKIPPILADVAVAFDRGEFEGLTQQEVDALAQIALTLKSQRRL